VDAWFFKYLAGIQWRGFGNGEIVIAPQYVSDITELKATVRGITVSYDDKKLEVSSPYPFRLESDNKVYDAGNHVFDRDDKGKD
jgi:hypothetical protein